MGDLNADGVPDLAVANLISRNVRVLRGVGDGTFQPRPYLASGGVAKSVAIANLDSDSIMDLVATSSNDEVIVWPGIPGHQTVGNPTAYPVGDSPVSVAAADLDGDGIPDLVTANQFSNDVSVLLGDGDAGFKAAVPFAVGVSPQSVAIADFDRDAIPDIVTVNATSNDVTVLLGQGDGGFQPVVPIPACCQPYFVTASDLDSDTFPDLVIGWRFRDDVAVLLGNGDGSFRSGAVIFAGRSVRAIAAGDLDGDGVPDIATANEYGDTVSTILNLSELILRPEIDIWPGDERNLVEPDSDALVLVAILGSADFDPSDVDVDTLGFGPDRARPIDGRGGELEDVNGDGRLDLLSHYRARETGITPGDTQACLTGAMRDEVTLEACDAVLAVPRPDLGNDVLSSPRKKKCGLGFELALFVAPLLARLRRRTIPSP